MSNNQHEQKYTPSIAEKLLYLSLASTQLTHKIQQAHVDGHMPRETYNELFNEASELTRRLGSLEDEISTSPDVKEAALIQELRNLPISVQITPRAEGYAFQVLDQRGTLPTFTAAMAHALSLLIGSLIEGKLDDTLQNDNHNN